MVVAPAPRITSVHYLLLPELRPELLSPINNVSETLIAIDPMATMRTPATIPSLFGGMSVYEPSSIGTPSDIAVQFHMAKAPRNTINAPIVIAAISKVCFGTKSPGEHWDSAHI